MCLITSPWYGGTKCLATNLARDCVPRLPAEFFLNGILKYPHELTTPLIGIGSSLNKPL